MHKKVELAKNYEVLVKSPKRYNILIGGRAGARSYTVSRLNTILMTNTKQKIRGAIMRYIRGDIRKSIFQEFVDSIGELSLSGFVINGSNLSIRYGQNTFSGIGFKTGSSQQKSKLKSLAGINIAVIEEADEVDIDSFDQLDDSIRAEDAKIFLLLNPPHIDHFIVKRFLDLFPSQYEGFFDYSLKKEFQNTTNLVKTNYTNNKFLSSHVIQKYQSYGDPNSSNYNPYYYYTQILGLIAAAKQGLVFVNWEILEFHPFDNIEKQTMGMDFGFNDPTALVLVERQEETIYVKELIYRNQLTTNEIISLMEKNQISKEIEIIADSARLDIIEQIKKEGYNIKPATKGPGSLLAGINYLQNMKIKIVDSPNLHRELKNYTWQSHHEKGLADIPIDANNHAIDAIRYAVSQKQTQPINFSNDDIIF